MVRKSSADAKSHKEEEESVEELTPEQQVQNAIKTLPTLAEKVQAIAINGFLIQKRKLDDELEKQINAIDLKYRKQIDTHLSKINEILEGTRPLTPEDFQGVDHLLTAQEKDLQKNYLHAESFKGFWLRCLQQSEFGAEIKPVDEPILEHLNRIQGVKSEDGKTLTVKFYFSENPWFENSVLLKEFTLEGDEIKNSHGDVIRWKEGKNVTVKIVKKKQKNKKTGERKNTSKEVKEESFFHFFSSIDLSTDDAEDNDEDDDENNEQVEQLEQQYVIANAIYEEIIPYGIEFYLGVGYGPDYEGLEGLEEEEEEEEEEVKPKKNKCNKAKGACHNGKCC